MNNGRRQMLLAILLLVVAIVVVSATCVQIWPCIDGPGVAEGVDARVPAIGNMYRGEVATGDRVPAHTLHVGPIAPDLPSDGLIRGVWTSGEPVVGAVVRMRKGYREWQAVGETGLDGDLRVKLADWSGSISVAMEFGGMTAVAKACWRLGAEGQQEVECVMVKPQARHARVVWLDGSNAAGATLYRENGERNLGVANEHGELKCDVAVGDWVYATHAHGLSASVRVPPSGSVVVVLKSSGRIAGRAITLDGAAVKMGCVQIGRAANVYAMRDIMGAELAARQSFRLHTDADGSFSVLVPPGTHSLTVEDGGLGGAAQAIVRAGEVADVVVTCGPKGRLVCKTPWRIREARAIRDDFASSRMRYEAFIEGGEATWSLIAGKYDISVECDGMATTPVTAVVEGGVTSSISVGMGDSLCLTGELRSVAANQSWDGWIVSAHNRKEHTSLVLGDIGKVCMPVKERYGWSVVVMAPWGGEVAKLSNVDAGTPFAITVPESRCVGASLDVAWSRRVDVGRMEVVEGQGSMVWAGVVSGLHKAVAPIGSGHYRIHVEQDGWLGWTEVTVGESVRAACTIDMRAAGRLLWRDAGGWLGQIELWETDGSRKTYSRSWGAREAVGGMQVPQGVWKARWVTGQKVEQERVITVWGGETLVL